MNSSFLKTFNFNIRYRQTLLSQEWFPLGFSNQSGPVRYLYASRNGGSTKAIFRIRCLVQALRWWYGCDSITPAPWTVLNNTSFFSSSFIFSLFFRFKFDSQNLKENEHSFQIFNLSDNPQARPNNKWLTTASATSSGDEISSTDKAITNLNLSSWKIQISRSSFQSQIWIWIYVWRKASLLCSPLFKQLTLPATQNMSLLLFLFYSNNISWIFTPICHINQP